jgi:hypothetical protein
VERLPLGLTEEFTLYLEHFIALDPGTGKIWASSTAHLDSGAPGYYGNQVSLNQTLYHVPVGDEWHFRSDVGPAFASTFLMVQPGHIGDLYQSDAEALASVYNLDGTASAVANTSVSVLASSCQPVIRDDGGGFTVDGVPTNGFVAGPGSGRSGSITIYGQCMDDVTQITFSGLPGLTATRSGAPAPVAGSPIPGLQTLSASYQASDAGLSADPAAAMWGYMVVNTADGRQSAHPAVLAKRLPAITSVIPYPWQSGSVVPYTIYGAGFGAKPTVSIVLDNQATVGQPVVTKCVPIACSDNFIEGTVALLPAVLPDWATVTVGYAGYLSFVPEVPFRGGQGGRVPVLPSNGCPLVVILNRPMKLSGPSYSFHSMLSASGYPAGGIYSWTTDNPSMIGFDFTASDSVTVSVGGPGKAAISVSYRTPCGTASDSLSFVLTDDVSVVGFVDGSAVPLPSGAKSTLVSGLNNAFSCTALLASWQVAGLTGEPAAALVSVDNDTDRRYANAFLVLKSANADPPNTIADPQGFAGNSTAYRAYNRFQAYYESGTQGIRQASVVFLKSDAKLGRTPEPCSGLQMVSVAAEEALINGLRKANEGLVYQVNSGRLGSEGQQVNAYLNKRQDTGPVLWPMATPYIWSGIEFDSDGNLRPLLQGGTLQIFPSYVLYRNGRRVPSGSVAQSLLDNFIALDWLSYFVLPF